MDVLQFIREHQGYFEDFVTRSTYHSNAIENSTLSYEETHAILWSGNSAEVAATARERYEALNYKHALVAALDSAEGQLTEALIKRIAHDVTENANEVSNYRRIGVFIRGSEHLPPAANQVNQLMMQLVYEYNHDGEADPFWREARFHVRFERIHPFEDGNGRTGRILINRGLAMSDLPPAVIPFERQAEYKSFLATSDADGLTEMLRELSKEEQARMDHFAEHAPTSR